jgi:hypothetical protein
LAETSRALKPTQQLHHLKLGSNHHNELPEIFQHLATISGAAGCLFDLHSMMMGLVTLKSLKKIRLGSSQKNQLHAKARAAVQRNLTPEERNLACEDSKSTPVNTIQWCLATKVSQAKTKVSQKRLRTWSRFRLRPFRPVSVIESNREAKLSLTVILGKL